MDLPEREKSVRSGRRRLVVGLSNTPLGLSTVAELATEHLDELAEGSDLKLFEVSRRVGFRNSSKVVSRLRRAGVDTTPWEGPNPLAAFSAAFADQPAHERTLLEDIASLGDTTTELASAQRWSLPELADLLQVSGYHDIDYGELRVGLGTDTADLRRRWLRTVSRVFGIDEDRLAAQAQHVLARTSENETSVRMEEWSVLLEEAAPPVRCPNIQSINETEQSVLINGLFAASTWFVDISMWLLCQNAGTWDREKLFRTPLDGWSPRRSSVFRQVAIVADPPSHELLTRAAASEHSADRNAARNAIEMVPELDVDGTIRRNLASDPDLWVRGKPRPGPDDAPPAEFWTCPWCPTENAMEAEDCSGCEYGVRSDAEY